MALLNLQSVSCVNDVSSSDSISMGSDTIVYKVSEIICERLDSIISHASRVADFTNPHPMSHWSLTIAFGAVLVSFLAAYYTWIGASFSKKTAKNVERMAEETQMSLLEDIVRHLYRNKVCTHALLTKMKNPENKNKYPSEEHFLKLSTLPEDIHMESYNKNRKVYTKMHGLSLLLRNYNIEIEVIQKQLCNPYTSEEVWKHGAGTLIFKPYFLISQIVEVMDVIMENQKKNWFKRFLSKISRKETNKKNQKEKVVEIILREHFSKLFNKFNDARNIPLIQSVKDSKFVGDDDLDQYKNWLIGVQQKELIRLDEIIEIKKKEIEIRIKKDIEQLERKEKEFQHITDVKEKEEKKEEIEKIKNRIEKEEIKKSLRSRYEKIKKEIIANGDNKRSLLTLTKTVTAGNLLKNNGEINVNSGIEPDKFEAIGIKSKNVFDPSLIRKFIETENKNNDKNNTLKAHIYNEIYLEDYTGLYLEEYNKGYKEEETYENTYQDLHLQTNREGRKKGVDEFDLFNTEWDAFDMLHKALIKDVTIEYDVIRMIPYPEKSEK